MNSGSVESGRHDRTLDYTDGTKPEVAAGIGVGVECASTAVGQVATLSALNMLVRSHPEVILAIPDVPLRVPSPTGGTTLSEACRALATAIDSQVTITEVQQLPTRVLSIGIGPDAGPAFVYAGGLGWTATTSNDPLEVGPQASSLLGLSMAVALGVGAIFRSAIGLPAELDRSVSLWKFTETHEATGPDACGPVDVGTTWMIGAGAVGSGLAWWLHFVGAVGTWTVIDGDEVESSNLNRSLGLFAADVGLEGGRPAAKASAAASLIGGSDPQPKWWDDWAATDPPSPDVLLPLANDYGVRSKVAAYSHPAIIHSTTSRDWTAELHTHLSDRDDCMACRFPEDTPQFACATAPVGQGLIDGSGTKKDASLPFLSGAAGLLLLAGLLQLQHGVLVAHQMNHWIVAFDQRSRVVRGVRWTSTKGCVGTASPNVRRLLHGTTRWRSLDPDGSGSNPTTAPIESIAKREAF